MSTYTTKQGDMWDQIAYEQLGDATRMDDLLNLNAAYREYYRLPAGIVLTLPEPETTVVNTIAPWKRAPA